MASSARGACSVGGAAITTTSSCPSASLSVLYSSTRGYTCVTAPRLSSLGSITHTRDTASIDIRVRTCFEPQYPHPTTPTRSPDSAFITHSQSRGERLGGAVSWLADRTTSLRRTDCWQWLKRWVVKRRNRPSCTQCRRTDL